MNPLCESISWGDILKIWEETLAKEKAVFPQRFRILQMHDPRRPSGYKPFVAPWPREGSLLKQINYQKNFFVFREYFETFTKLIFGNAGTHDFFLDLTGAIGDRVKMSGLIIAAALWSETSRGKRLIGISGEAYRKVYWETLKGLGWDDAPWSIKYSSIIPLGYLDPIGETIDTPEILVKAVAIAFAKFLQEFELVLVTFHAQPDPEVLDQIEKKEQESVIAHQRYLEKKDEEDERRAQQREVFKLAHPMCDDWAKLTAQDLHRLVWAHPVTYLANQFGLSDAAIHKKCKKMGVAKPAQGHWLKASSPEK